MAMKPFTPIPPMAELPPAEDIKVQEILDKYLAGEIDLICVLGPTASGKTRYAVQLARQINSLLPTSGGHGKRGPCHPRHESGGTTSEAQWWGERSERPRATLHYGRAIERFKQDQCDRQFGFGITKG